jgi:cysteine-rich repeat protein
VNGDGCSSVCLIEAGFVCSQVEGFTSACQPISTNPCGNGVIDAGEQCDDRGNSNGDGCSSTCQT